MLSKELKDCTVLQMIRLTFASLLYETVLSFAHLYSSSSGLLHSHSSNEPLQLLTAREYLLSSLHRQSHEFDICYYHSNLKSR